MKLRTILIALFALGLAGAAVYVRRKRAAEALATVQLGSEDGGEQTLSAGDLGVAELQDAASALRRAFEGGA